MYSPSFGRFLQTDPLRFDSESAGLYRYVANGPVNRTDPEGLMCCPEDKQKIQQEKDNIISASRTWNKTSPPYSRQTNQCFDQAYALVDAIEQQGFNVYWISGTIAGSKIKISRLRLRNHTIVIVSPNDKAEECGFTAFTLDPFKGDWWKSNSQGDVTVGDPDDFRKQWPK